MWVGGSQVGLWLLGFEDGLEGHHTSTKKKRVNLEGVDKNRGAQIFSGIIWPFHFATATQLRFRNIRLLPSSDLPPPPPL